MQPFACKMKIFFSTVYERNFFLMQRNCSLNLIGYLNENLLLVTFTFSLITQYPWHWSKNKFFLIQGKIYLNQNNFFWIKKKFSLIVYARNIYIQPFACKLKIFFFDYIWKKFFFNSEKLFFEFNWIFKWKYYSCRFYLLIN